MRFRYSLIMLYRPTYSTRLHGTTPRCASIAQASVISGDVAAIGAGRELRLRIREVRERGNRGAQSLAVAEGVAGAADCGEAGVGKAAKELSQAD